MKKTILFVILEQYADWESAYLASALYMLGQGKYEAKTVSLTTDRVASIGGFHVVPDYDICSVPEDYEAVILVGGMSWRNAEAGKIAPLAKQCFEKGKVLGAICDASAFLGTIGLLNHVEHTSNDLNDLKQWAGEAYTGEANYIAKQAVSHKNVVTANGTAALEFAKEVLLALEAAPEEKIVEWFQFHKLGYYASAVPKDATSWND